MDILKIVHTSHRTYNDLKPDNIMINILENGALKVTLIDYGLADKYVEDGSSDHISSDSSVQTFRGNLFFSSLR